jgi:flavodoxin I
VAKPLNINRASAVDFASYPVLIIGTPTYAEGGLPGKENKTREASWLEFLPELEGVDFSGKRIALYGLGDQEEYPDYFLDGMGILYEFFSAAGATMIGDCTTEGYQFNHSRAVIDGRFIGLALDQHLQHLLTDQRIDSWLDEIEPQLGV